ncbi:MAG: hypothetical protein RMK98_08240 [Bacteroidia bacterium]|nr:hypothetical protein [Bacteroidia bacterium]
MDTPVLLLVYNRLDTLQQVWEVLRRVKPRYLFVSRDGPKANPADQERTEAVQRFIESHIDWRCEATFRFNPTNQGLKLGVASGITWFFSQVEAGIILEDDTLPHPDFFTYATEMLERYWQDERIGCISGYSGASPWYRLPYAWDFIRFPLIWGWATWRRVWKEYDVDMKDWPSLRDSGQLRHHLPGLERHYTFIQQTIERVYRGTVHTWDTQLTYLCLKTHRLTVVPRTNLIMNIGHGHGLSTSTRKVQLHLLIPPQPWERSPAPPLIAPNHRYEEALFRYVWNPSFALKVYRYLRREWVAAPPKA